MKEKSVTTKNIIKFIIYTIIGAGVFLIPIPKDGSFTPGITIITDLVKFILQPILNYLLLFIMCLSLIFSLIGKFFKPNFLKEVISVSWAAIITKIITIVIVVMVLFKIGPDFIISSDTGANMVSLATSLISIVVTISFFIPFLTDSGIMEFLGVLTRKIVKPLFKVPGRASVDLIASWFGASNAAVILTKEQYDKGYYTNREAGIIMTNFSLVSVPFCILVAETLGLVSYFPKFYFIICVVGILLAFILTRIPPLSKLPNTYNVKTGKQIEEEVPENISRFKWALMVACERAEKFGFKNIKDGTISVIGNMYLELLPIVVTWGTISLILVMYTPLFKWISYPMGIYLNILGVEDAFAVAPATLAGFIDMFIPALLSTGDIALKTKFIIGVLSLVQIIYLTEVGTIILKSEVSINLKELIIIFLERTIIAIPIIVLLTNLLL